MTRRRRQGNRLPTTAKKFSLMNQELPQSAPQTITENDIRPIEKAKAEEAALNARVKPLFDMDFFSAAAGFGAMVTESRKGGKA